MDGYRSHLHRGSEESRNFQNQRGSHGEPGRIVSVHDIYPRGAEVQKVDEIKKARTEGVEAVIELVAALANERLEALEKDFKTEIAKHSNVSRPARSRIRCEVLTARYDELQRFCAMFQQKIEAWPQEGMPSEET
jgi:hypothetical protein